MWGGLGWVWMFGGLLGVLAVAAVVLYALPRRGDTSADDEALATLRQRYAAGEVDGEEFERREVSLRGTSARASEATRERAGGPRARLTGGE